MVLFLLDDFLQLRIINYILSIIHIVKENCVGAGKRKLETAVSVRTVSFFREMKRGRKWKGTRRRNNNYEKRTEMEGYEKTE